MPSKKISSALVVTLLLSHTVLAPLTAVAQEQDTSPQQVQKTTDSNKSVSIDSPEASENIGQDSTTQGNSQTQTENIEGAGPTHGGEMSDKSKLDDDGQMKEAESDSATDVSSKESLEPIDTWMPDKKLQTAVSEKLGISVPNITKKDMLSLKRLDINEKGISNITGLEYASNVTDIRLYGSQISDITPLQNLTSLTGLYLSDNQISDITPLQNLTSLTSLGLIDNQISDITPLQNLTSLTRLGLSNNQISDITPLQNLTSLTGLDLSFNQISDITLLQNLTSLTGLNLCFNQISDITPLQNLTSLTGLDLGFNQISDITLLQNLTSLTSLALSRNQISDITPLQNLTSLTDLYLSGNQISDITPLQNLTSLTDLYLSNNQISDISSLAQLTATISASGQLVVLPEVYVHNRKPYSISIESPIKSYNGLVSLSPQNNDTWTGVYNSGKMEWSGGNQVSERGGLSSTWNIQDGNTSFSGTYTQPYILSKATITAHNSTIYAGDNWNPIDNFDSALDHEGNPLDFSKIAVSGTVDTSRPGVYSVVYSYDGLEEKVEVTVEEKPSTSEPSKGEVTPEEKPSASEASKGEVTPEGKPSTPEASKGEVQSKKEKASKELPATGEKDTKIFSAIGLGILAILGTYISRKKRSDS